MIQAPMFGSVNHCSSPCLERKTGQALVGLTSPLIGLDSEVARAQPSGGLPQPPICFAATSGAPKTICEVTKLPNGRDGSRSI